MDMLPVINRSAEIEAAVKRVVSKFGKVGILVNNVGLGPLVHMVGVGAPNLSVKGTVHCIYVFL